MAGEHLFIHMAKFGGGLAVAGGLGFGFWGADHCTVKQADSAVFPSAVSSSPGATLYTCKGILSTSEGFGSHPSTDVAIVNGLFGAAVGCVVGAAFPPLRRAAGGEAG
jgi:hypothetical protein